MIRKLWPAFALLALPLQAQTPAAAPKWDVGSAKARPKMYFEK